MVGIKLSPIQCLVIGQFIEDLISCEEAANSFNVTEKKFNDTIESTDLKRRIKRVLMKKETLKTCDEFNGILNEFLDELNK